MSGERVPSWLDEGTPGLWLNPRARHAAEDEWENGTGYEEALNRFRNWRGSLAELHPDFARTNGTVDSPLIPARPLQPDHLDGENGTLWIKGDHRLPVARSVKARGGFHEVLEHAEALLGATPTGGESLRRARRALAHHRLEVGSTGNLGLSIGIMGSLLGFQVTVHMSREAKEWKKERLRKAGARVVDHDGDYERAVSEGRKAAAGDADAHFVDDLDSRSLLWGYSTAASLLKEQLRRAGTAVGEQNPLFVYIPCGVGGAPAGIALGLRREFGGDVHCFFVEPVQSPSVLLGLLHGSPRPVYDHGLTNRTDLDGLAVPLASGIAVAAAGPRASGVFTVTDADAFRAVAHIHEAVGERVEPSAAAALPGPRMLTRTPEGRTYLERHALNGRIDDSTHIVWATGGSGAPEAEFNAWLNAAGGERKTR
ncbi:D-serine ammonia-lyase [Spirillospora sp. NPDC048819]|uniref:D-serine ammonia-lyase n=1 Tax=Spirillospora sp. NPDC048819 TaxID=3155268 RepID=UPI0033F7FCC8